MIIIIIEELPSLNGHLGGRHFSIKNTALDQHQHPPFKPQ